jgi:hypothetical protein
MQMSTINFDNAIVAKMIENAVGFCSQKIGLKDREQVLAALHCGDCSVCEYLRYGLAKGLAEYLGSVDDTVKAIYTYEPGYATSVDEPAPGRPNLTPGINLLAWVSRKSAALSSVVASMGSALSEECGRFTCPNANVLCYELDVKVADDDEVRRRTGYGALIDSLYVRPMEIWHR